MDAADWVITILLLFFATKWAIANDRRYRYYKSEGEYKNNYSFIRKAIWVRRGYKEADRKFFNEQENNRQSAKRLRSQGNGR